MALKQTVNENELSQRALDPFSIAELQNECPTGSVDMIRRVFKNLRAENRVECLGCGQNAQWRKTSKWQLGNIKRIG